MPDTEAMLTIAPPRALKRGVVEVLEREALADPGVIHDDVEPSELGERARHRRLHRRPVGDIGRDREAASCQGFDAGARLEGRLEVDRRHVGAHRRQTQGDRLPDAAAGARHEGDLTGEVGRCARMRRHAAEDTT